MAKSEQRQSPSGLVRSRLKHGAAHLALDAFPMTSEGLEVEGMDPRTAKLLAMRACGESGVYAEGGGRPDSEAVSLDGATYRAR